MRRTQLIRVIQDATLSQHVTTWLKCNHLNVTKDVNKMRMCDFGKLNWTWKCRSESRSDVMAGNILTSHSTASASPYCFGYTWADISATIWGCAASSISTKAPVSLNFVGATLTKTWSAYYYTPSAAGSSNQLVSAASSLRSASGAGQSASSSPSPTPISKSSTNIGPIIGGVVGGLAVLGAIAFGIVFLLMRKRKNKKDTSAAAAQLQQQQQQQQQQNAGGYPNTPGQDPNQRHMSMAPVGGAAVGYYGQQENKQPMSELGTPQQSPGAGYLQPAQAMKDPNTPYHDNRVSAYSDAGSPVPPYQQPYQQQMPPIQQHVPQMMQQQQQQMPMQHAPMELDATPSPHMGQQGQPVYEAPAGVPGSKP
jgi:pyruvate/2-oxoglutarate dehydrogenase complex dihydrolipoamide acyltransferase (E2) component